MKTLKNKIFTAAAGTSMLFLSACAGNGRGTQKRLLGCVFTSTMNKKLREIYNVIDVAGNEEKYATVKKGEEIKEGIIKRIKNFQKANKQKQEENKQLKNKLKKENNELKKENNKLKQGNDKLKQGNDKLKQGNNKLKQGNDKLKQENKQKENELIENFQEKNKQLKNKLKLGNDNLQKENNKLKQEQKQKENELIKNFQEENKQLQNKLKLENKQLQNKLQNKLKLENDNLQEEIKNITKRMKNLVNVIDIEDGKQEGDGKQEEDRRKKETEKTLKCVEGEMRYYRDINYFWARELQLILGRCEKKGGLMKMKKSEKLFKIKLENKDIKCLGEMLKGIIERRGYTNSANEEFEVPEIVMQIMNTKDGIIKQSIDTDSDSDSANENHNTPKISNHKKKKKKIDNEPINTKYEDNNEICIFPKVLTLGMKKNKNNHNTPKISNHKKKKKKPGNEPINTKHNNLNIIQESSTFDSNDLQCCVNIEESSTLDSNDLALCRISPENYPLLK